MFLHPRCYSLLRNGSADVGYACPLLKLREYHDVTDFPEYLSKIDCNPYSSKLTRLLYLRDPMKLYRRIIIRITLT